jgi:hypothetical protein
VVELFSRAEIKISVKLDIINISKLMMPSQGEMGRKAICSNMHVKPKRFMWKERCGFSNGLRSPDNLLAEWKEIRKKSKNCRQESRGHHERGSLANIRKGIFGYPSISQKPTKDPLSLSNLPRIGKPVPERLLKFVLD